MMTSPTPTTVIPATPMKLSTTSTITVDDNERIVAIFATMNTGLDARFDHSIKAISSFTSGCKQIEKELGETRTSVKRKLAGIQNDQYNHDDRPFGRRPSDNNTSHYGPTDCTNRNCPVFNELPPSNHDNKGREYNGLL